MILSLLLAFFVAAGVFLAVRGLAPQEPVVDMLESRLRAFGESGRQISLAEAEMTLPLSDRFFRPVFERLGRKLSARVTVDRQQALQEKINLAGRPGGLSVGSFLVLRYVALVVGGLVGYLLGVVLGLSSPLSLVAPVACAVVGMSIPKIVLQRKVKARQKEILLGLPSALDLLTISVEAGLGFDAALARVVEKYKNALSSEFSQVLAEVRLGRQRMEALDDLGRRCKVEELNNFVQAIVQSEQLGVGIANVLRIQSEEIRRRRRQRAEELGQKAPLKMLFPMVGCIFPTLFIVLLGPAVIQVGRTIGH
ncbi:MAG: type II secretion system F family protein [Candidatus Dormibacteria bacterium]